MTLNVKYVLNNDRFYLYSLSSQSKGELEIICDTGFHACLCVQCVLGPGGGWVVFGLYVLFIYMLNVYYIQFYSNLSFFVRCVFRST